MGGLTMTCSLRQSFDECVLIVVHVFVNPHKPFHNMVFHVLDGCSVFSTTATIRLYPPKLQSICKSSAISVSMERSAREIWCSDWQQSYLEIAHVPRDGLDETLEIPIDLVCSESPVHC